MFVDYYALLCIKEDATNKEIKKAFKEQAIKWHPDKNPGIDTTERMQLIIEAYYILIKEANRKVYDETYQEFKVFKKASFTDVEEGDSEEYNYKYQTYQPSSEILNSFVKSAKDYAQQKFSFVVEELRDLIKTTAVVGGVALFVGLQGWILSGLILSLVVALFTCGGR